MNQQDPVCTGINGKSSHLLWELGGEHQTGECVQGDTGTALSSPAHSEEKSRVFYQLCEKPAQSWHWVGFVFQRGLTPCSVP